MSTGRRALAFALFAAAGCQTAASPSDSDASVGDASIPVSPDLGGPVVIYGKFASELSLDVTLDRGDGGTVPSGIEIPAVWVMQSRDDGSPLADGAWELCDLPVPGLVDVPVETLDPAIGFTLRRVDSAIADGARVDFPRSPSSSARSSADGSTIRSPPTAKSSVQRHRHHRLRGPRHDQMRPGVPIPAAGLDPDVDLIYLDLRRRVSPRASISRSPPSTARSALLRRIARARLPPRDRASTCAPADVARLEAAHPARAHRRKATVRSHLQGIYFTCPQLLADPQGSLGGDREPRRRWRCPISRPTRPPPSRGDPGRSRRARLRHRRLPRDLHRPEDDAPHLQTGRDRADDAELPAGAPVDDSGSPTGGRFVNEVPLPPDMRARWLQWIDSGTPLGLTIGNHEPCPVATSVGVIVSGEPQARKHGPRDRGMASPVGEASVRESCSPFAACFWSAPLA